MSFFSPQHLFNNLSYKIVLISIIGKTMNISSETWCTVFTNILKKNVELPPPRGSHFSLRLLVILLVCSLATTIVDRSRSSNSLKQLVPRFTSLPPGGDGMLLSGMLPWLPLLRLLHLSVVENQLLLKYIATFEPAWESCHRLV